MIAMEHMKEVESFFDQWRKKVYCDMIEVMLNRERIIKHLRREQDQ